MGVVGHGCLLDSNIVIGLINGNASVLELLSKLQNQICYVSIITMAEVLTGLDKSLHDYWLGTYPMNRVINVSDDISVTFLKVYLTNTMRRRWIPDALIAATVIVHQLPLLTLDKGFAGIEGLQLHPLGLPNT